MNITVQDSGPGLKAEDIERIFERFYRTDSSRQREDGGSGLGLAIARSIVQAHGGQLSAETSTPLSPESEAGQGLKIVITLPGKSNLLKRPSPAASPLGDAPRRTPPRAQG